MAIDQTNNPIILTVAAGGSQEYTPEASVPAAIERWCCSATKRGTTGAGQSAAFTVNRRTVLDVELAASGVVDVPFCSNATSVTLADHASNTLARLATCLR